MLLSRLLGPRAATPENPTFDLNSPDAWDALGATPTSTGVQLNAEKVLTWSAWWRGVNLLAKGVAKCPCHVYKTDPAGDHGSTPDLKHPAYTLLRWKPNEYQTAFQFRLALVGHAINRGNGYAYVWRSGPDPVELTLLDPDSVTPVLVGGAARYVLKVNGEERKLNGADVFHLRGFGCDGLQGYPLWQMARECIALGMSAERFRGSRYKNAARPSVVLETPNKMEPQAVARLRTDWDKMHSGIENAHRTAILENGMKVNQLSFSPEEMQEVESAGLLLRDAANFLGIPSSKLGDVAGVKYASKEQDDQNFLDDGLDFWMCSFESEAWDKLLLESEKDAHTRLVVFDRESLIRMDFATAANYYRTATGGRGWMSPAEVRGKMHLEPREEPDIDKILTPLNMGQGGPDNQPAKPGAPQPGRPTDGAEQKPPAPAQDKTALRAAAALALTDATRRMVRRIALHANRAATVGAKYLAWLTAFAGEHGTVVFDAFRPACASLLAYRPDSTSSSVAGVAGAFLYELRGEYSRLADTTGPNRLAAAVEALGVELETRMPRRMEELFLGATDE